MITLGYVKTKIALEHFVKDNRGVTAIEYAILAVAVSAIVLAVFGGSNSPLKAALSGAVSTVSANINSANG
ncbi:Flp family type IVb pilin [Celerinatantimonas yamalensis]|uniref:Flp family type IVb pilin n=1 Tax=Celerinatantimonas yamalensis TaxID=559956 RepID=A0ABW9G2E4_9GAMM